MAEEAYSPSLSSPKPEVPYAPEVAQDNLFDFAKEKEQIDKLLSSWKDENTKTKTRREVRANKRNVQEERDAHTILPHETIIPDRTIDLNIRRGRAPYISYVTKSRRVLILEDVENPSVVTLPLEDWFTTGMRYPRWKYPWLGLIDAILTHGGAALEVIYDPSAPLNVRIEYIARENLIFDTKTHSIQSQQKVLRKYELTVLQLEEFAAEFGFEQTIIDKLKTENEKDPTICIDVYKVFCKKKGIVYNSWYIEKQDKWLREPVAHDVGLFYFDQELAKTIIAEQGPDAWKIASAAHQKPLYLKEYPLSWFKFDELEDTKLLTCPGRVARDIHVQEALTELWTNVVNATNVASWLMASAEQEPGGDAKLEELGPIKRGVVMNRKLTFYNAPWPEGTILQVAQALSLRNNQDAGSADFAAIARKDANKTATEMQLATKQSEEQSGIGVELFSNPYLEAYTLCFKIACHQAIFGLCHPPNKFGLLFGNYNPSAAGDVEVVKRQEDMANAQKFFEVLRGTPAAEKILSFLISSFFPDQAPDWLAALNQPDKTAIIAQLLSMLQTIPVDELSPEQRTGLSNIINLAQSVVAESGNGAVPSGPGGPAQPNPTESNAPAQPA